jgi:hypothetical protein
MKKCYSWEPNTSSSIQEFSLIQWNLKFHYHVHNSPPLAPILSQKNPSHDLRSLTPNLILSSHHWSVSSNEFLIVPESINLSVRNHVRYTLLDRRIELNWALNKYGTVQPAYSGTTRDLFFRCMQVPFDTCTWSSSKETQYCGSFLIKTGFCSIQVPFWDKFHCITMWTVFTRVWIDSRGGSFRLPEWLSAVLTKVMLHGITT